MRKVTRARWPAASLEDDEIGLTPGLSPRFPTLCIPYGCLVPERLEGLLACGRQVSRDRSSNGFLREISQRSVTGQAAGTAADGRRIAPRAVEPLELQQALRKQGAPVRSSVKKVSLGSPAVF